MDIDNTPENIRKTLLEEEYSKAIMMALKLNEGDIVREVLESIKYDNGWSIFFCNALTFFKYFILSDFFFFF